MNHYGAYLARINRVFDHIDAHLDAKLDVAALAAVAHVSVFHFHRLFKQLTGETLAACVRRRRVEVAASRMIAAPEKPAARIAEDVGFASAEVFTRAFRAGFGMTPTAWRRGGHRAWAAARHLTLGKIRQEESKRHQAVVDMLRQHGSPWPRGHVSTKGDLPMHVEIKTFNDARVAYMRHVGPYGSADISQMWQRFGAWCREEKLVPPARVMYGICQDDPGVTAADKLRYDAGIEVGDDFKPHGDIGLTTLQGGRYACARFAGKAADIGVAWSRFVSEWLPDSGYAIAGNAIERYGEDFKMDAETGAFECELCLPVRRV